MGARKIFAQSGDTKYVSVISPKFERGTTKNLFLICSFSLINRATIFYFVRDYACDMSLKTLKHNCSYLCLFLLIDKGTLNMIKYM